jgi:hypothetical protein
MNISFHITDQILILQKQGYVVKREEEDYVEGFFPVEITKTRTTWRVYKDGKDAMEEWMDRLEGDQVIAYFFESELRRKILSLF